MSSFDDEVLKACYTTQAYFHEMSNNHQVEITQFIEKFCDDALITEIKNNIMALVPLQPTKKINFEVTWFDFSECILIIGMKSYPLDTVMQFIVSSEDADFFGRKFCEIISQKINSKCFKYGYAITDGTWVRYVRTINYVINLE